MENRGILVYCITDKENVKTNESIKDIRGLDENSTLYTIEAGGLAAVASDVDLNEYGEESMAEKGEDINWLRVKAAAFMDVILKIMSLSDVIPMKFLTIFVTEDRVRDMMTGNSAKFRDILTKTKNRREYSVKIYCDNKRFKDRILSEEIAAFEKTLTGKPKGAAFFLRKKFDSELDEKIMNRISGVSNRIAEELKASAADMKSNKTLAKELTGIELPMILNCAYLTDINRAGSFAEQAEAFRREYEEAGFMIELSGPWPPYSFCHP